MNIFKKTIPKKSTMQKVRLDFSKILLNYEKIQVTEISKFCKEQTFSG